MPHTVKTLPTTRGDTMELNIDIAPSDRAGAVKLLNTLLADEYVPYTKTRNYHWNVASPRFNDLHKFFEGQYEQLAETVDEVAAFAFSAVGRRGR